MLRLRSWLELLLPTRCLGCDGCGVGGHASGLCPRCRTRIPPLPSPRCGRCHGPAPLEGEPCGLCTPWPRHVARARSLTPFRGPAASAIGRIKYQGWTAPAQYLGERLARALAREPGLPKPDVVVAVPSTPGRVRERGFNPAELLARGVAEGLEIPLVAALERPLESPRQVGLPPSQRSTNVRGAFVPAASGSREVARRSVLLVDDVLTTGATAVEAADVLVACGAREVTLASVARALPEDPDFVGPQP